MTLFSLNDLFKDDHISPNTVTLLGTGYLTSASEFGGMSAHDTQLQGVLI